MFATLTALGAWLGLWRDPFFKADDFAVIEYASHGSNVLHDFGGAQYGLQFFFRFWRPLITLSLAMDQWLFGAHPLGFHLDTMLAHVLVAWLLFCLVRRLGTAPWPGAVAALLFLVSPVTQLSSLWVVGRVDVHAAVWLLLAALLHVRSAADRWPRWPLLPFALALATKETGIAYPLLAIGLDLLTGRRRPWRHYLPALALAALYLGWRTVLFGTPLGGYAIQAGVLQAQQVPQALRGLSRAAWVFLAPGGEWPLQALGGAAVLATLLLGWRRGGARLRPLVGAALLLAAVLGPLLPFLQGQSDLWSMRYFYLAAGVVLALLAALANRAWPLAVLAAAMLSGEPPLFRIRDWEADNRFTCWEVQELGRSTPPGTPVLVDVPREQLVHPYRLLWGIDRLHAPPFTVGFRRVLALHPLHPAATERKVQWPILACARATGSKPVLAAPVPAPQRVPDLTQPITGALLQAITEGRAQPGMATGLPAGTPLQALFLSAQGTAELPVTAGTDGQVTLKELLLAPVAPGLPLFALLVNSLDMELSPRFYVCLSSKPEQLLELEFDRSALPFLLQLLR